MQRHLLWGDEAETALFAKSILQNHIPYGWDGVNIMGLYNGIVLNTNLVNTTSPWAQYYLTALSFFLFGISTFTARLPFVIFSIISMFLLFYLIYKVMRKPQLALLYILYLAISIPYVLFAYQSRYFALTTFSSIVIVMLLISNDKWNLSKFFIFSFVSALFFHSHYLSFISFFLASTISAFIFLRPDVKHFLYKLCGSVFLTTLFTLPWLIWAKPNPNQGTLLGNFNITHGMELILRYFYDLNENAALPITIILLYIFIFSQKKIPVLNAKFIFIVSTCLLYIIFLSILSTQIVEISNRSYIRYAMNIFPLTALIAIFAIYEILMRNKLLGILIFCIFSLTNIPALQPPFRIWLFDYMKEMTNTDYQSSTSAVVQYLNKNSREGETVFVTPDYNVEPLLFYSGKKLKFINRISPKNNRLLTRKNSFLPDYIYQADKPPDWIVMFGKSEDQFNWRKIPSQVNLNSYTEVMLPIYSSDLTRPEIFVHSFYPVVKYKSFDAVFIYKKRG